MIDPSGIPNLFSVEQDKNIWRGGDPTPEGWKWLRQQGALDVVKLNTESEGSDIVATDLGMTVHRFPIPWWRQTFWRPKQSTLVAAVACITQNVYVHCERGQDRTGLVIGCFRLSQGWHKADAYVEMIGHKFHVELQGLQGAWDRQVAADWLPK